MRDCAKVLDGFELQNIKTDTNLIKFGIVFIKSSISQTFWIRNDLATFIKVQLKSDFVEFE